MPKNENYNLIEIGSRLKLIRARQRKTQAKMAQELGISLSHYSKLEVGIGGMSHGLIYAICRQFSIPEEWLVYGEGETPDFSYVVMPPRPTNLLDPLQSMQPMQAMQMQAMQPPVQRPSMNQRLLNEDDELLEKAVALMQNENLKNVASNIAKSMNMSLVRAMTMLVREKLRKPDAAIDTEDKNKITE